MPWMVVGPYEKYETLVDDEDVHLFLKHDWTFDGRYIKRKLNGKRHRTYRDPARYFYLHREIMQPGEGMQVDHINGDKLDNRRSNLRLCTPHQNNMNRAGTGIYKKGNSHIARITHNYVAIHIGSFKTEEEAQQAVLTKRRELRGEFAYEQAQA
jgi:hypothetical protein